MTREEVYGKLVGVFQDVFDDESIEISDETTANDIEGWDSLSHISLLSSVEDEFEIKFVMKEVQGLKNVGAMVDLLIAKLH